MSFGFFVLWQCKSLKHLDQNCFFRVCRAGICSRVKGWKIDSWNRLGNKFGIEVPMSHVHVKINFSYGIDSWNRCLSVHKRLQIRAQLEIDFESYWIDWLRSVAHLVIWLKSDLSIVYGNNHCRSTPSTSGQSQSGCIYKLTRARICRPFKEPRARIWRSFKETRYRFSGWRAGTKPYLSYWPARQHRLAKSIPRNRFLGSINVYKYGLRNRFSAWRTGTTTLYVVPARQAT